MYSAVASHHCQILAVGPSNVLNPLLRRSSRGCFADGRGVSLNKAGSGNRLTLSTDSHTDSLSCCSDTDTMAEAGAGRKAAPVGAAA